MATSISSNETIVNCHHLESHKTPKKTNNEKMEKSFQFCEETAWKLIMAQKLLKINN